MKKLLYIVFRILAFSRLPSLRENLGLVREGKSQVNNSGTILVVDNDEGVCAFIEMALRLHGFAVFVASSGKAALNLFREQRIDIVLMDVKLPDQSGPETLKRLQSIRPDVPCFFMTASGGITKEHLGGAIGVFEKPFRNLSEVVRTLSEILDKRSTIKHPAHPSGEAHLEQKSRKTLHDN
jgi:two-component system response regulator (stage 0 sporulation protein F)